MTASWGADWGTFTDENPTGTEPTAMPLPIISWDTVQRRPSEAMKQLKQRMMTQEADPDYPGDHITTYVQFFDSVIQFKIWTKTSREARLLSNKLEDLLVTYLGHFKEQGIGDLVFEAEAGGAVEFGSRQELVCRSLTYTLKTQAIKVVRSYTLREVATQASLA